MAFGFGAKYKLESGAVVDTAKAAVTIEEGTRWDGRNHISLATGSQWDHETLYRSSKGRWYIESFSNWQGSTPYARELTAAEASEWITLNDKDPEKFGLVDTAE